MDPDDFIRAPSTTDVASARHSRIPEDIEARQNPSPMRIKVLSGVNCY
jgi:hypothetical protein